MTPNQNWNFPRKIKIILAPLTHKAWVMHTYASLNLATISDNSLVWTMLQYWHVDILWPLGIVARTLVSKYHNVSHHYSYVIMSAMSSYITGVSIVCINDCSGANKKKTSILRVTGLCDGNLPVTSWFPSQRNSNTETVSILWRHHVQNGGHFVSTSERVHGWYALKWSAYTDTITVVRHQSALEYIVSEYI